MNEAGEQFAPERTPVVPEAAIEAASSGEGPGTATGAALAQAEQQPVPNSPSTQSEASQALERLGWMGSLQSLLTTVVIAVFAITFVVQAFRIPSESMQNTLLIGDYLLVDKAHFGPAGAWGWLLPYQKIRRGDIVVFRWPVDPKQHFVKRVIGTPGDRIRLVNKRVFVNGQLQLEPYVIHIKGNFISFRDNFPNGDFGFEHPDTKWVQQLLRFTEDGELIVPDGYFFVMGDNRDDSSDSRYWGFVPRENIVGRPLVIYWSMRGQDGGDTPDGKAQPDGKLTRFAVAVKQGWQDLRWSRMLTLVH